MAFNVAVFKTRTLTAIVFVIVMLTGLLWNQWSFFALISIIHIGCWIEYQKLVEKIDPGYANRSFLHSYGTILSGCALMCYFFFNKFYFTDYTILQKLWLVPIVCIVVTLIVELLVKIPNAAKNCAHSTLGLVYISLSWALYVSFFQMHLPIHDQDQDLAGINVVYRAMQFDHRWFLPVVVLACMWINDTMAYIVGSFIGKTPFSKISPKKTWEGTLGGIILCIVVVGLMLSSSWMKDFEPLLAQTKSIHWFIIAAIAAIAGTAGDLFESKLKRLANVKDSGSFMPGHGGFLDRFDSLLIATPFVWLYIVLFMQ